jgi:hypothetical protein
MLKVLQTRLAATASLVLVEGCPAVMRACRTLTWLFKMRGSCCRKYDVWIWSHIWAVNRLSLPLLLLLLPGVG